MNIDFLDEKQIKYYIDRDKRKNSYIQIKDGNVIIKVPKFTPDYYISKFVNEKKNWILKNVEKYKNSSRKNLQYTDDGEIYLLGKPYKLNITKLNVKRSKVYVEGIYLNVILPITISKFDEKDKIKTALDKYYKSVAKEEVFAAMEDLINKTGLKPKEVNIKNLSATWGICSSKKIISINQNLMMYSRHAIEYVCLHELCHLKHMNHSKDFWDLVEYYLPDYKEARKELKE